MKSRRLMGRPFRPTTYPITPPGLRTLVTRDRERADKRRCQRQPQFTTSWGLFRLSAGALCYAARMSDQTVIVWDLETIPDIAAALPS
jgi:hypothetical protein